jgi:hypothetical protein
MLLADLAALLWVAMSSSLTSRNANIAIIKTISRILILPWILFAAGAVMALIITELFGIRLDWRFYLSFWFAAGILTDLGFGLRAWLAVRTRFRELALPGGT